MTNLSLPEIFRYISDIDMFHPFFVSTYVYRIMLIPSYPCSTHEMLRARVITASSDVAFKNNTRTGHLRRSSVSPHTSILSS
jgi:hypothetical protein